jgi:primary-amine oxidase
VSLSGILEMKATSYTRVDKMKSDVYGTLVAENTLGVYHDHFITYHLDLDVDSTNNSFVKNNIVPTRNTDDPATGGADTPRRSYWTVRREVAETEADDHMSVNGPPAATTREPKAPDGLRSDRSPINIARTKSPPAQGLV